MNKTEKLLRQILQIRTNFDKFHIKFIKEYNLQITEAIDGFNEDINKAIDILYGKHNSNTV